MPQLRVPCVGAILTDGELILLIRRGHEPEAGRWSLPGGRVEPGETDEQALVREVREETGLEVTAGPLVGAVDRSALGGRVLAIRDYAATISGGTLAAGDDADDARWFSMRELPGLPLSTGLLEALNDWGVAGPVPSQALVAEATRRAGVVWLTVPGRARAYPAWHLWRDPLGAAYLVTGPGEQPLPGLAGAARVAVTVPSKESRGTLVTWTAEVSRVVPGSPEWAEVIGPLAAARLNADLSPDAVYRLSPRPSDGGTGPRPIGGFRAAGSGGLPPGRRSAPPD
jgi:mutator protein MutT